MPCVPSAKGSTFHPSKRGAHLKRKKNLIVTVKKVLGRGLVFGAVFIVLYIFLFGNYGIYRMWKQKREIEQLRQTLEALRLRQEQLKLEAYLLENDPEYIEKIAREEYGMMKAGEIIYKIVDTPQERVKKEREMKSELENEKGPGSP
ncbi:MAG: septum formation initiator family protein [Gemmatimonadota bacterium]|nr:MAG: septum formation initiator family protein [Gemmatimonadota bacterium]